MEIVAEMLTTCHGIDALEYETYALGEVLFSFLFFLFMHSCGPLSIAPCILTAVCRDP